MDDLREIMVQMARSPQGQHHDVEATLRAITRGGQDIELRSALLALVVALAICALGYRRVTLSARILGTALILEVLILLVVTVLIRGGADGITFGSFDATELLGPGIGAMLVFAFGAFLGIEATAIYSEEAGDPRRTVPRTTYIAVALRGVFYTVVC